MNPVLLRIILSQPGVQRTRSAMISEVRAAFPSIKPLSFGSAYYDARSALCVEVSTTDLPPGFVSSVRKRGHASTSVGPWLLDAGIDQPAIK